MSLETKPLYSLADISTIPCVTTDILSRKECDPSREGINGRNWNLPIIVSPMSCNYLDDMEDIDAMIYEKNHVNVVLPRTMEFSERLEWCTKYMTAFSMTESDYILKNVDKSESTLNICMDMANGHMESQILIGKQLKDKFGDKINLMGGNIANPETYSRYVKAGFDFVRVGIGGGNACFTADTKITMADGSKKEIGVIKQGDEVLTKNGTHKVVRVFIKEALQIFIINNEIKCTIDHEFYVVNKSEITSENLLADVLEKGKWVKAYELKQDEHCLVKYFDENNIKLIAIKSINVEFARENLIPVFDLEVEEEHTYLANDFVVHNCLTSTQSSVHYPMASLLNDITEIRKKMNKDMTTKVVADGGISGYSDAIKCLALGADFVMMGKVFTKASIHKEPLGTKVPYYGMSTKKAQSEMGNKELKTSEGRSLTVEKEYTLEGWVENFSDYLKSAMSYTDCRNLKEFNSKVKCQVISPNSSYAINNK